MTEYRLKSNHLKYAVLKVMQLFVCKRKTNIKISEYSVYVRALIR